MCNKIGIIERGELLVNEDVDELIKKVRRQIVLRINVAGAQDAAAKLIEQHSGVAKVELTQGEIIVTLKAGTTDYGDLASVLVSNGHKLTMLKEDELNLEGAFMALTKGITA